MINRFAPDMPVVMTAAMLAMSLVAFNAHAELSVEESGTLQQALVSEVDPNVGWRDFLLRSHLTEGSNSDPRRGENYTFLVASGSTPVGGNFSDSWISERNAAYEIAVISAKATIAQHLESVMNSTRGIESLMPARDAFVPEIRDAIDQDAQLSLVQKEQNLAHHEIDEQIMRYDPAWDGTQKSDKQRADKLVDLRQVLTRKLDGKADELVKGALPIFSAEGYDDRGQYVVLVGLAWSPKTIAMAKSFLTRSIRRSRSAA